MRKLAKLATMILTGACLAAGGCREETPAPRAGGPLRVVVSIPPLAWAVEEMAPDGAEITQLIRAGASPHGFELTPSHVRELTDADVVVLVGFGMEPQVEKVLADHPREDRRVIFLADSVATPLEYQCDHQHDDPGHDHLHASADPHAWLDPLEMREFLGALAVALGADPTNAQAACDKVHEAYEAALVDVPTRWIVTHHNAYGYLARRYALVIVAVIQPIESVEPTPGDIRAAVDVVRKLGVGAIFVEPQFSATAAERIAQITGVRVLPLDPLGDDDWPAMMLANLEALVQGLNAAGGPVE